MGLLEVLFASTSCVIQWGMGQLAMFAMCFEEKGVCNWGVAVVLYSGAG